MISLLNNFYILNFRNANKNSLPSLTEENKFEVNYTEKPSDLETTPPVFLINNLSQKGKENETPAPTAGNSIKSEDKSSSVGGPGKSSNCKHQQYIHLKFFIIYLMG